MSKDKIIRCAIYTRKSTEDGLDQEFNSLQAQREAAEAYIKSQQHERWQAVDTIYEDGGFSGGNMDRPGLAMLIADIEAKKVDMIVVYKVDRLSRSLHDFAKMVETFDRHGVSFVSVTQQFNTSTSMGRLTLNVLLSFAQFEREVTAERIRDKIAASKRKGMWMGGRVPFGYDVIARKLVVNEPEAEQLRTIFHTYLKLGSVDELMDYLESKQITNKVTENGVAITRKPFARNTLYTLLRHPVYLGKISFRDEVHEGQHTAILDPEIWQQAQELLDSQIQNANGHYGKSSGLLLGKLHDFTGKRYWSTAAERQKGKQRRYYYQKKTSHRVSAQDIEPLVMAALHLPDVMDAMKLDEEQQHQWKLHMASNPQHITQHCITRIVLGEQTTRLILNSHSIQSVLADMKTSPDSKAPAPPPYEAFPDFTVTAKEKTLEIELQYSFLKKVKSIVLRNKHNETLLSAIGSAWRWEQMLRENPSLDQKQLAIQEKVDARYLQRALNLLFLAPDILTSILDGTQPDHLTMDSFKTINLPICWKAQRKLLRIAS